MTKFLSPPTAQRLRQLNRNLWRHLREWNIYSLELLIPVPLGHLRRAKEHGGISFWVLLRALELAKIPAADFFQSAFSVRLSDSELLDRPVPGVLAATEALESIVGELKQLLFIRGYGPQGPQMIRGLDVPVADLDTTVKIFEILERLGVEPDGFLIGATWRPASGLAQTVDLVPRQKRASEYLEEWQLFLAHLADRIRVGAFRMAPEDKRTVEAVQFLADVGVVRTARPPYELTPRGQLWVEQLRHLSLAERSETELEHFRQRFVGAVEKWGSQELEACFWRLEARD